MRFLLSLDDLGVKCFVLVILSFISQILLMFFTHKHPHTHTLINLNALGRVYKKLI